MWLFKEFFEGTGLELWNFLRNFLGASKSKIVLIFKEHFWGSFTEIIVDFLKMFQRTSRAIIVNLFKNIWKDFQSNNCGLKKIIF